eukprot:TRINITY_DN36427_c0_g1_i2.p1 TRINITY_DN36427_c0_g1~~TRINITY_DN36427_c0_g1_i2.p1  ORF type:complete len:504 (-),score=35.88 TRINITY_DN36427_c0_g1_i2:34-1545(-)
MIDVTYLLKLTSSGHWPGVLELMSYPVSLSREASCSSHSDDEMPDAGASYISLDDPDGAGASMTVKAVRPQGTPRGTWWTFVGFALFAQGLMSYDGGATQMSQEALYNMGWSAAALGWLGAMDKIGQVLTAPLWGPLLKSVEVKTALIVGLFLKALSCYCFGALKTPVAMFAAKLGMGVFEALVGIWAMLWIEGNAGPSETRATWQGFLGISAGIGNGVGVTVAGLFASTYGYSFAFTCQAVILFGLCIVMAFTPSERFSFHVRARQEQRVLAGLQSMSRDCRVVLGNQLWLYTQLSLCLCTYSVTGVGYLWQNTMSAVWDFNDTQSTFSLIAVTGAGGLVGTQLGPKLITKFIGDFSTPSGRHACLRAFTGNTLAIAWCGTFCAFLLLQQAWHIFHYQMPDQAWGWLLASLLCGLFLVVSLVNCMTGALISMNINSCSEDTKPNAVGLAQAFQNVIGYACGMVVPSCVANEVDLWLTRRHWLQPGVGFTTGMAAFVLSATQC